jgi:focal adhesion kinase 1
VYFSARDYELVRNQVELGEFIGEGQFGDVHKGTFKGRDNQLIPVAVKTCKADADLATAEKFLEEACKYLLCGSLEIKDC